jgi:hypothetical protein
MRTSLFASLALVLSLVGIPTVGTAARTVLGGAGHVVEVIQDCPTIEDLGYTNFLGCFGHCVVATDCYGNQCTACLFVCQSEDGRSTFADITFEGDC